MCIIAIGELREAAGRMPDWQKLKRMTAGRKEGAEGRLNKAIRAAAMASPLLSAAQLWEKFKAKPPKGYTFNNGADGNGERFEPLRGRRSTGFKAFENTVSGARHPK